MDEIEDLSPLDLFEHYVHCITCAHELRAERLRLTDNAELRAMIMEAAQGWFDAAELAARLLRSILAGLGIGSVV
jgi:hypothetical protein